MTKAYIRLGLSADAPLYLEGRGSSPPASFDAVS